MKEIQITDNALSVEEALAAVKADSAGAINLFIGTVRSKSKSKQVVRLEYESYDKMVLGEIEKIVQTVKQKWPVEKIVVHHRKGTLQVGEIAVIIAVATPHRKDSFEACQYTIDTLKKTVPIWKKEVFDDGEEWVGAHP